MKIISYCFIYIFLLASSCSQSRSRFEIVGNIINAEGKKVFLTKRGFSVSSGSKIVLLDSCIVHNGKFLFQGSINESDNYAIFIENSKEWRTFILDNCRVELIGNSDSIWQSKVISSSTDQALSAALGSQIKPLIEQGNKTADDYHFASANGDTIKASNILDIHFSTIKKIDSIEIEFIRKHPKSFKSLDLLLNMYSKLEKNQSKELFNSLSFELQNHSKGKYLRYNLFELENLISINAKAISFTQKDTAGREVSLEQFTGKYLLIDFWASWCGPCRAEIPKLKKVYDKYKNKGFEIAAISLDTNKDNWEKAINEEKISAWCHLSDLQGGANEVAIKYGIRTIPSNFLLDKGGYIIAKDLSVDKLLEKLSEIFDGRDK
ncbi:MAG: TlpA disulfide reductase family protein [Bacteroidota bacterium]|nr:TlpA disulfide reductase family protein [Bacteroidota bacterium]